MNGKELKILFINLFFSMYFYKSRISLSIFLFIFTNHPFSISSVYIRMNVIIYEFIIQNYISNNHKDNQNQIKH